MVWEGIMQDTRTPLHVFDNGSMDAQTCRQEVLESYVCLFRGAVGPEFIFMETMRENIGLSWFMSIWKAMTFNEWLGQPIFLTGILLNMLGRAIAMRQPPPRTILELKIALVEEWEGLPTSTP